MAPDDPRHLRHGKTRALEQRRESFGRTALEFRFPRQPLQFGRDLVERLEDFAAFARVAHGPSPGPGNSWDVIAGDQGPRKSSRLARFGKAAPTRAVRATRAGPHRLSKGDPVALHRLLDMEIGVPDPALLDHFYREIGLTGGDGRWGQLLLRVVVRCAMCDARMTA